MKLRTKLFLTLTILFIFFTLIVWFVTHAQSETINEQWGAKFVQKQIEFDKYRTLMPIIDEIALVKQLAQEPAIIAMALHEDDVQIRSRGFETLERYRSRFHDRSYFAAFTQSRNFYYNDNNNPNSRKNPSYKISPDQPADKWFYEAISSGAPFQINIDKDRFLGVSKVWINYIIRDNNDNIVGVIGTGFDFDYFFKQSVGFEKRGGENYFIKKDFSIQLDQHASKIDDYIKMDGSHKSIESLITDPADIKRIKEVMDELEQSTDSKSIKTLWVTLDGEKHLLGIGYTGEVGWFNLSFFHSDELPLVDNKNIFILMSVLFLIAMIVLEYRLKNGVIVPIEKLIENIDRVRVWDITDNFPILGSGEIAELSSRFNGLIREVKENHATLEEKIQKRTEELVASEAKLQTLAFYDSLTNLANRRLFLDRLIQAQSKSNRSHLYGAVIFIDLDNFKPLNDTYGHSVGDLLLIDVARRIKTCMRESDTVARFGGDEFIVLLSELSTQRETSREQAAVIAEKIRQSLSYPYFMKISSEGFEEEIVEHSCSASIGLTLFVDHDITQDEIINEADRAMYQAKEEGRNKIVVYQPE